MVCCVDATVVWQYQVGGFDPPASRLLLGGSITVSLAPIHVDLVG